MSELIWRSEVVEQQKLDYTHPLASDVKFAVVPNTGIGDSLFDVVDGQEYPFAANSVDWKSDGVGTDAAFIDDLNGSNLSQIGYLNSKVKFYHATQSYIYILDAKIIATTSNNRNRLFYMRCNNLNYNEISVYASRYSEGLQIIAEAGDNVVTGSETWTSNSTTDAVTIIHYSQENNQIDIWHDGQIVNTVVLGNVRTNVMGIESIGLGGNHVDTTIRMQSLLVRNGNFTTEQIQSLAANPYQLFETKEDKQADNGLKWDAANQGVHFKDFSATNPLEIEVTLAEDYPSGIANSEYILDGRSSSANYLTDDGSATYFWFGSPPSGVTNITLNGVATNSESLKLAKSGDVIGVHLAVTDGSFMLNARFTLSSGNGVLGASYSSVKVKDDTKTYFYSFNQNPNTPYVKDLYGSGNNATLVNFPTQSGYVREVGSHDGVEFDATNSHRVELEKIIKSAVSGSGAVNWEFEFQCAEIEGDEFVVISESGTGNLIIIRNDNRMQYRVNNVQHHFNITDRYDRNAVYKFTLEYDGTGDKVLSFYENGNFVGSTVIAYAQFLKDIGKMYGAAGANIPRTGWIKYAKYTDLVDNTNSFHHDFTKTEGSNVPDLLNNNQGTMIGGSGLIYYRPVASNELVGYRFNGVDTCLSPTTPIPIMQTTSWRVESEMAFHAVLPNYTAIPLLGREGNDQASITIRVTGNNDNFYATVRVNTSSNQFNLVIPDARAYLMDGKPHKFVITRNIDEFTFHIDDGVYSASTTMTSHPVAASTSDKIFRRGASYIPECLVYSVGVAESYDGAISNSYNFTTGDTDTIPDTIGNNHATIVNTPTSGFLPVIEKQVFTVGNYGNAIDFGTGKNFLDGTGILPVLREFTFETEIFVDYGVEPNYSRLLTVFHTNVNLSQGSSDLINTSAVRSTHSTGSVSTLSTDGLYNLDGTEPVKIKVFSGDNESGIHVVRLWVNDVYIGESSNTQSSCYTNNINNYFSLGASYAETRTGFDFRGQMRYFKIEGYETQGGQLHSWEWDFNHSTVANGITDLNGSGYSLLESGTLTSKLVSSGKDYDTFVSAVAAQESPTTDIIQEFLLYGKVWDNTSAVYWDNDNNVNYTARLVAADNVFNGVYTEPHFHNYTQTGSISIFDAGIKLEVDGVIFKGCRPIVNNGLNNKILIKNSYIDGDYTTGKTTHLVGDSGDMEVHNSVITNFRTSVDRASPMALHNCILWNNAGTYGSWSTINYGHTILNNCIIGEDSNRFNYGTTAPKSINTNNENCQGVMVFDDSSAVPVENQNQPITTWLTDPTNGDFTINQSGQDALKGQGWNGSDICVFAYTSVTVPTETHYTLNIANINTNQSMSTVDLVQAQYMDIGSTNASASIQPVDGYIQRVVSFNGSVLASVDSMGMYKSNVMAIDTNTMNTTLQNVDIIKITNINIRFDINSFNMSASIDVVDMVHDKNLKVDVVNATSSNQGIDYVYNRVQKINPLILDNANIHIDVGHQRYMPIVGNSASGSVDGVGLFTNRVVQVPTLTPSITLTPWDYVYHRVFHLVSMAMNGDMSLSMLINRIADVSMTINSMDMSAGFDVTKLYVHRNINLDTLDLNTELNTTDIIYDRHMDVYGSSSNVGITDVDVRKSWSINITNSVMSSNVQSLEFLYNRNMVIQPVQGEFQAYPVRLDYSGFIAVRIDGYTFSVVASNHQISVMDNEIELELVEQNHTLTLL